MESKAGSSPAGSTSATTTKGGGSSDAIVAVRGAQSSEGLARALGALAGAVRRGEITVPRKLVVKICVAKRKEDTSVWDNSKVFRAFKEVRRAYDAAVRAGLLSKTGGVGPSVHWRAILTQYNEVYSEQMTDLIKGLPTVEAFEATASQHEEKYAEECRTKIRRPCEGLFSLFMEDGDGKAAGGAGDGAGAGAGLGAEGQSKLVKSLLQAADHGPLQRYFEARTLSCLRMSVEMDLKGAREDQKAVLAAIYEEVYAGFQEPVQRAATATRKSLEEDDVIQEMIEALAEIVSEVRGGSDSITVPAKDFCGLLFRWVDEELTLDYRDADEDWDTELQRLFYEQVKLRFEQQAAGGGEGGGGAAGGLAFPEDVYPDGLAYQEYDDSGEDDDDDTGNTGSGEDDDDFDDDDFDDDESGESEREADEDHSGGLFSDSEGDDY
eukprot:g1609.t1